MSLRSRTFRLESRDERLTLDLRAWPYWWHFGRGRHLGFLPHREGNGTWYARYAWRDTSKASHRTRHRQLLLGRADDHTEADGFKVLSFGQAWDAAKKWVAAHEHQAVRADFSASPERLIYAPVGSAYTVGHAIVDYLRYCMMYRKAPHVPMYRANRYILPHIGTIIVDELTSDQIREWLEMVAKYPAQRGTGKPFANPTMEQRQRRRHSANAVLSTLTAALNIAFRDGKVGTDVAWRRVRKFRDIHHARVRYLLEDEARALIAASPTDFRTLVLAGLFTGCRASELLALAVGALDAKTERLYVAPGKSNWARWLALPDEGLTFFREQGRGRPDGAPMFLRDDGSRWKITAVQACMVQARRKAGLDDSVVFHTLRHTYASYLVMAGASLLAVMKLLGHADIRLVVHTYAHLSPDFLADTVRLNFPRFLGAPNMVSREWRGAAQGLSVPGKGTTSHGAPKFADPWDANPAAVAARRWTETRVVPTLRTYERLAGKM